MIKIKPTDTVSIKSTGNKGYDSHSWNCYHYWPNKFSDLDRDDPTSINSIKVTHDHQRFLSKPVSFALQYWGTEHTLQNQCGFSIDESEQIVHRYNTLYAVSKEWAEDQIAIASKQGYYTTCFGLRIRAPLLGQVILGNSHTPYEAQAEARTLGNAITGQAYCQLNSHACMLFMKRVRASKYKYDIRLCALIHDAIYLYVEDKFEVIEWVNKNLIECMAWNELPELQHDQIKIGSELSIFYPTWKDEIVIPNNADVKQECINEANKRRARSRQ